MVEVINEVQDLLLEVRFGGEVASLQEFASQNTKPDFNLIEPGAMFGGEMENHLVVGIGEELSPGTHRLKNARLALDP